jgi:RND family efflux transporter MFP subunit
MQKILDIIKRHIKILCALVGVLGIFFLIYLKYQNSQVLKNRPTYVVKRQNLTDSLSFSGKLDALEKVTLRFQTAGRLAWIGASQGDSVKKYQVIANLDQTSVKKNLEKELNDYKKVRNDFDEATLTTYKDKVITDTIKRIYEKNQADLNNAVLDVELSDLARQYSSLWTPIDGIVTRVSSPYPGINLSLPTQAEFDIVNPKTIYFSAFADQTEVVKLRELMEGSIVLDPYPNQKLVGKISQIDFLPREGETGTVYEVKMDLGPQIDSSNFRLGMTGEVEFILREKGAVLAVPLNLIRMDGQKKYVKALRNGNKNNQYILTGETYDNLVEVTDGLIDGDLIYSN